MKNLEHLSCFKTRATWFCEALADTLNTPVLRGTKRYNLYAKLLGFDNHSQMVNLYHQNSSLIGAKIARDLNELDKTILPKLQEFHPNITSWEARSVLTKSMPDLHRTDSDNWKKSVERLLAKPELDLRWLRGYSEDIYHYIPETIIALLPPQFQLAIKYQLRAVVITLDHMATAGVLKKLSLIHIFDLLHPTMFYAFDQLFRSGTLGVQNEPFVRDSVPRYVEIAYQQMNGRDEECWHSLIPLASKLTGKTYLELQPELTGMPDAMEFKNDGVRLISSH